MEEIKMNEPQNPQLNILAVSSSALSPVEWLEKEVKKRFGGETFTSVFSIEFEKAKQMENPAPCQTDVIGSVLSDEEMREPIENALYSTKRFITTQATDLAEGILEYIKDAGYTIVRNGR